MKKVFICIFILIVATSCSVCRNCRNAAPNSTYQKDSVIIKESIIYRDTLIPVIVKDTTVQESAVPTDTARAETDLAKAKAWLESDSLRLTITNKPDPVPPVKASIPEKARTETKTLIRTEVKTVEINRLTKWQKAMISLGYIFIGICGSSIAYLFWKLFRK